MRDQLRDYLFHIYGRSVPSAIPQSDAAKVLGVEPGTLRVQIHNGKLKAKKVGPIWTVTPKEVERYRKESRRG